MSGAYISLEARPIIRHLKYRRDRYSRESPISSRSQQSFVRGIYLDSDRKSPGTHPPLDSRSSRQLGKREGPMRKACISRYGLLQYHIGTRCPSGSPKRIRRTISEQRVSAHPDRFMHFLRAFPARCARHHASVEIVNRGCERSDKRNGKSNEHA